MKSALRRHVLVFVAFGAALGWGCGKPLKLVPVGGVVVNGTKPVPSAAISFAADTSKGGETLDGYGSLDGEGHFAMKTVSRGTGLPPGRYKVVITTDGPSSRLIPASITSLTTTPLVVDIPEDGAQDLKLDLGKYK
jgi:hypothetical protein